MSSTISASGNNLRNILAMIRRAKGWDRKTSQVKIVSGGEDGLYRIHLSNNHIVEANVIQRSRCCIHATSI